MQKQLVRTSKVLTSSYVVGDTGNASGTNQPNLVNNSPGHNQLVVEVDFTLGNVTSGEVKVELTYDGVNYLREANASVSGGVSTMTANEYSFGATGKFQILVPLAGAVGAKISAKETGADTTNCLMAINAYTVAV